MEKSGNHDSINLQLVTVDLLTSVFGKSWARQHTPRRTRWISVNPQWSRRAVTGVDKQLRFLDTAESTYVAPWHLGVSWTILIDRLPVLYVTIPVYSRSRRKFIFWCVLGAIKSESLNNEKIIYSKKGKIIKQKEDTILLNVIILSRFSRAFPFHRF